MSLVSTELNNLYESLKTQALERNDKFVAAWSKYMNDLEVTKSLLISFPKKITYNVMVPIGPKALMPGKIVHTNEFLVNLGETWFVKRTAHQTIEICDRRIKNCVEMLQKLEKERDLIVHKSTLPVEQEAFGNKNRPEIIEYVTEEENEKWKEQHRIKEKRYRQQLAELRNKEKKPIETEVDLWKHLDELELQEELEDELNRLNSECGSENIPEEISDMDILQKNDNQNFENEMNRNNLVSENDCAISSNTKRKVSFACDLDSADDEPLILEIKHSELKPVPSNYIVEEINSPSDIYNHYAKLINKKPLSILKCNVNSSEINYLDLIKSNEIFDEDDDDNDDDDDDDDNDDDDDDDDDDDIIKEEENFRDSTTISQGIRVQDISERCTSIPDNTQKSKPKKISQFKASRKKN